MGHKVVWPIFNFVLVGFLSFHLVGQVVKNFDLKKFLLSIGNYVVEYTVKKDMLLGLLFIIG